MPGCTYCGKPAKWQCSGCHWALYCSERCSHEDWESHRDCCVEMNLPVYHVKSHAGLTREQLRGRSSAAKHRLIYDMIQMHTNTMSNHEFQVSNGPGTTIMHYANVLWDATKSLFRWLGNKFLAIVSRIKQSMLGNLHIFVEKLKPKISGLAEVINNFLLVPITDFLTGPVYAQMTKMWEQSMDLVLLLKEVYEDAKLDATEEYRHLVHLIKDVGGMLTMTRNMPSARQILKSTWQFMRGIALRIKDGFAWVMDRFMDLGMLIMHTLGHLAKSAMQYGKKECQKFVIHLSAFMAFVQRRISFAATNDTIATCRKFGTDIARMASTSLFNNVTSTLKRIICQIPIVRAVYPAFPWLAAAVMTLCSFLFGQPIKMVIRLVESALLVLRREFGSICERFCVAARTYFTPASTDEEALALAKANIKSPVQEAMEITSTDKKLLAPARASKIRDAAKEYYTSVDNLRFFIRHKEIDSYDNVVNAVDAIAAVNSGDETIDGLLSKNEIDTASINQKDPAFLAAVDTMRINYAVMLRSLLAGKIEILNNQMKSKPPPMKVQAVPVKWYTTVFNWFMDRFRTNKAEVDEQKAAYDRLKMMTDKQRTEYIKNLSATKQMDILHMERVRAEMNEWEVSIGRLQQLKAKQLQRIDIVPEELRNTILLGMGTHLFINEDIERAKNDTSLNEAARAEKSRVLQNEADDIARLIQQVWSSHFDGVVGANMTPQFYARWYAVLKEYDRNATVNGWWLLGVGIMGTVFMAGLITLQYLGYKPFSLTDDTIEVNKEDGEVSKLALTSTTGTDANDIAIPMENTMLLDNAIDNAVTEKTVSAMERVSDIYSSTSISHIRAAALWTIEEMGTRGHVASLELARINEKTAADLARAKDAVDERVRLRGLIKAEDDKGCAFYKTAEERDSCSTVAGLNKDKYEKQLKALPVLSLYEYLLDNNFAKNTFTISRDAPGSTASSWSWAGLWEKTKTAGEFATIGLSIGSIVPVIGTAIGGAVGAVLGLMYEEAKDVVKGIGGSLLEAGRQLVEGPNGKKYVTIGGQAQEVAGDNPINKLITRALAGESPGIRGGDFKTALQDSLRRSLTLAMTARHSKGVGIIARGLHEVREYHLVSKNHVLIDDMKKEAGGLYGVGSRLASSIFGGTDVLSAITEARAMEYGGHPWLSKLKPSLSDIGTGVIWTFVKMSMGVGQIMGIVACIWLAFMIYYAKKFPTYKIDVGESEKDAAKGCEMVRSYNEGGMTWRGIFLIVGSSLVAIIGAMVVRLLANIVRFVLRVGEFGWALLGIGGEYAIPLGFGVLTLAGFIYLTCWLVYKVTSATIYVTRKVRDIDWSGVTGRVKRIEKIMNKAAPKPLDVSDVKITGETKSKVATKSEPPEPSEVDQMAKSLATSPEFGGTAGTPPPSSASSTTGTAQKPTVVPKPLEKGKEKAEMPTMKEGEKVPPPPVRRKFTIIRDD